MIDTEKELAFEIYELLHFIIAIFSCQNNLGTYIIQFENKLVIAFPFDYNENA